MYQVVDPRTLEVVRPILVALYVMWGSLWALTAFHYGRAAMASWKVAGGSWRSVPRDLAAPFTWAVRDTLCRWGLFKGAAFCGTEVPSRYYKGHLLRFAIFLGSLSPVLWGFYFLNIDRSDWSSVDIVVNAAGVALSILAAGCHLFLAYKTQPNSWRRLVLCGMAWLLLAPPMLTVILR